MAAIIRHWGGVRFDCRVKIEWANVARPPLPPSTPINDRSSFLAAFILHGPINTGPPQGEGETRPRIIGVLKILFHHLFNRQAKVSLSNSILRSQFPTACIIEALPPKLGYRIDEGRRVEDRLYGDGWGGARPNKRMKYVYMCIGGRERKRGVSFDCCPVSKVRFFFHWRKKKIGFHENFTRIPLLAVDLILMRKGNRWTERFIRGGWNLQRLYIRGGVSEEFPVA